MWEFMGETDKDNARTAMHDARLESAEENFDKGRTTVTERASLMCLGANGVQMYIRGVYFSFSCVHVTPITTTSYTRTWYRGVTPYRNTYSGWMNNLP